jgi:alkylation response protein AidB-like acyl-CoA dehydrogenase
VIVNGAKRWITGASISDYILALVRSGPVENRRRNLSFVIIPTKSRGVTVTDIPTMGSNGVPTCDITFDNVAIPMANVVGGEQGWNDGWRMLAGPALELEKLSPLSAALATAECALNEAWEYSQQRRQGGKLICGHQSVRHVLADAQTNLEACRIMAMKAAWAVENQRPSAAITSMAKLFVTETAKEIVLNCQQYVMGAYGYGQGFRMEQLVRDALLYPIVAGSSGIQKNNIAQIMGLPRE